MDQSWTCVIIMGSGVCRRTYVLCNVANQSSHVHAGTWYVNHCSGMCWYYPLHVSYPTQYTLLFWLPLGVLCLCSYVA